jgi:hypothetical protein
MKKNHTEKTQQESYSDKSFILTRGKGARQATVNDGSHTRSWKKRGIGQDEIEIENRKGDRDGEKSRMTQN